MHSGTCTWQNVWGSGGYKWILCKLEIHRRPPLADPLQVFQVWCLCLAQNLFYSLLNLLNLYLSRWPLVVILTGAVSGDSGVSWTDPVYVENTTLAQDLQLTLLYVPSKFGVSSLLRICPILRICPCQNDQQGTSLTKNINKLHFLKFLSNPGWDCYWLTSSYGSS